MVTGCERQSIGARPDESEVAVEDRHTKSHETKRLKRRLGVPLYHVAGILESLWQATIESADEGDIGRYSDEDIALAMEYEGDAETLIVALVETGWLDRDPVHRLVVHDWHEHAPEYIKERLKKRDQRSRRNRSAHVLTAQGQQGTSQGHDGTAEGHVPPCPEKSENVPSLSSTTQPNQTYPIQGRAPESPAAPTDNPSDVPAIPEKLGELIAAWNQLPQGIAPRVRKPHSEEITKGWKRTRKNSDVVAALDDIPRLMDAIRQATFCHGQGWFEFVWLMAKDDKARWNVLKVLEGNFRNGSKSLMTFGPGQLATANESRF